MKKPFNFENSSALIIGGGSGIGKEVAKSLCEHGADVIIAGRQEQKLISAKDEISSDTNGYCSYLIVDVTVEKSVDELMSEVGRKFNKKLNILVNSAGTNIRSPIEDVTLSDFQEVVNTNLTGTF